MKLSTKILLGISASVLLAGFASVALLLYGMAREMRPSTYAGWLDSSPAVYAKVDSVKATEIGWFAYAYDENKFVNAIPGATKLPKIADQNGHLPAFKLGDDIFILTWKWVNSSAGLAVSNSDDFDSRIEALDHCFRVRHLSGNIYEWYLDLDKPRPGEAEG